MKHTVMSMAEATERFAVPDHLYGAGSWSKMLLVQGGAEIAELDLHDQPDDDAYGWIIDGDLRVEGGIECCDESVMSLLVTGDLHAGSIHNAGADIAVHGNVVCAQYLIGDYNHGYIHIGGDLTAPWLIISDHDVEWGGTFHGKGVDVFSTGEHASLPHSSEDLLPSLVDGEGNRDLDAIVVALKKGAPILRA